MTKINTLQTEHVQTLLKRAAGLDNDQGNPRSKEIMHRFLTDVFKMIEDLDITQEEFWMGVNYLNELGANGEAVLLAPGLGFDHFLDVREDAKDGRRGRGRRGRVWRRRCVHRRRRRRRTLAQLRLVVGFHAARLRRIRQPVVGRLRQDDHARIGAIFVPENIFGENPGVFQVVLTHLELMLKVDTDVVRLRSMGHVQVRNTDDE